MDVGHCTGQQKAPFFLRARRSLTLALAALLVLLAVPTVEPAAAVQRFSDVPEDHAFAEEISWLADRGITEGRADGSFGVGDAVTRGAMAAFLYRFDGQPPVPDDAPTFLDVAEGDVFAGEISWLASSGITQGRDDGSFGVGDAVTRGAMAAFLYRFAGQPPLEVAHPGFPDVPDGHVFADAVTWLASNGITQGRADGSFGLGDPVTRGQMAAFLFRFDGPVFTVSRTGVAALPFGTPTDEAVAFVTSVLGQPDQDTGWTEHFELEIDAPFALDGYYEDPLDDFTWIWPWPWYRELCWDVLCLQLGGDDVADARLRGWDMDALDDDWATPDPVPSPPTPWVVIEENGITAGSSWAEVQQAYPQATLAAGEGATTYVNGVWEDFTWRLSWRNDFTSATPQAPADAQLVYLAGGTQRIFPCC